MLTVRFPFASRLETAAERKVLVGLEDDTIRLSRSCLRRPEPACDRAARFRTADGTCNNLRSPSLGSTDTPFARFFRAEPEYGDGISTPRLAKSGKALPNARRVSFRLFTDADRPSRKLSHLAMVWGQFIDHDITLAAQPNTDCSGKCDGLQGECFGIKVPADDPHFPFVNVDCIELARDVPALSPRCKLAAREQVNTKTAFIDSSHTYGTSEELIRLGRDLTNDLGLMKLREHPGGAVFKGLLPAVANGTFCRTPNSVSMPCFRSGDMRTNENQGTVITRIKFSMVWVRRLFEGGGYRVNTVDERALGLLVIWHSETSVVTFHEHQLSVSAYTLRLDFTWCWPNA